MNYLKILVLPVLFFSCQTNAEIKKKQYFAEGVQLYKSNCANCHQMDGAGLEGLYPAISSEFLRNNKQKVICLIKNGINDSLLINGKKYKTKMPANQKFEPLEIAEITTFINNKWGGIDKITEIDEVKQALLDCKK